MNGSGFLSPSWTVEALLDQIKHLMAVPIVGMPLLVIIGVSILCWILDSVLNGIAGGSGTRGSGGKG